MDLQFTEEENQFRHDLKAWLAEVIPNIPPEPHRDDWTGRRAWDTAWQRMLFDAGYAGINWPKEYGGRGATPAEHLIFLEETERAHAPYVGQNFVGLLHAGPTLIAEASPEQKAFHLPPILKGEHIWCQGFSEPGAGSDLASLSTRAHRDGDDYVINGQKIWTSFGHTADYCEMLVRTDPDVPKHRGISWLIVPMGLPGMDVRPLRTMEGSTEFCEVFFDEVRVPVANRVGAENDGWRVTMVTLSFERGTAFISEMLQSMELARDLATLAKQITRGGASAWDDAGLRRDIGRICAELEALWALTKRNVSQAQRTGLVGPGGNVFKLAYAELRQRLGDTAMHLLDRASLSIDDLGELPTHAHVYGRIHALSLGIAAGTSQVQRNIVAERILGLPKDR